LYSCILEQNSSLSFGIRIVEILNSVIREMEMHSVSTSTEEGI